MRFAMAAGTAVPVVHCPREAFGEPRSSRVDLNSWQARQAAPEGIRLRTLRWAGE
jgi:hypothetical protein